MSNVYSDRPRRRSSITWERRVYPEWVSWYLMRRYEGRLYVLEVAVWNYDLIVNGPRFACLALKRARQKFRREMATEIRIQESRKMFLPVLNP